MLITNMAQNTYGLCWDYGLKSICSVSKKWGPSFQMANQLLYLLLQKPLEPNRVAVYIVSWVLYMLRPHLCWCGSSYLHGFQIASPLNIYHEMIQPIFHDKWVFGAINDGVCEKHFTCICFLFSNQQQLTRCQLGLTWLRKHESPSPKSMIINIIIHDLFIAVTPLRP